MRRVERQRRHQGEDVAHVALAQRRLLVGVELGVRLDLDAVLVAQPIAQSVPQGALAALEVAHDGIRGGDLLGRRAAVDGALLQPGDDLLLQAADALHEELVEVRGRDGEELDALEQRRALVLGLVQHAVVEREPRELPVEVQIRGGKRIGGSVDDRRRRRWAQS